MRVVMDKTALAATVEIEVGMLSPVRPSIPASLFLLGVPDPGDADDKVEIQYQDGASWRTLKTDGDEYVLDKDTNVRTLYGPGKFRLNRPAGTNPLGVAIA